MCFLQCFSIIPLQTTITEGTTYHGLSRDGMYVKNIRSIIVGILSCCGSSMLGKGSYYASLKVHRVDVDVIDVVLMAVIVVIVVVVLYLFRLLYGEGRRENGEWRMEK